MAHLGPLRPRRGPVRVERSGPEPTGQPIAVPTRGTTRTTVVDVAPGTSELQHLRGRLRARASSAAAAAISSSAEDPFIASTAPPGADQRQRPAQQLGQGRQRPGGDHVEALRAGPVLGPARAPPRPSRDPAAPPPPRGRRSAVPSARSGSPARPLVRWRSPARAGRPRSRDPPRSRAVAPAGATSAELTRCRSQSRPTSRGPIRPRRTPSEANSAAYCSIRAWRSAGKSAASTAGSGGGGVSRETSAIRPGAPPRSDAAPHPPTPRTARRLRRRRARPCARTATSDGAQPAPPTP